MQCWLSNSTNQSATLNAQTLALALPFLNRSLTIPSSATQGNRIFNNNNVGKINIRDGPYQGNKTYTNDSWNAYVATLLSNRFFNNDKGDSSSGRVESSNNLFPYVYPAHVISRPSMNLPESSIASQSRPRNLMSSMPSNNLSQFSLAREPRQEDIVNLSDLSLVSQPRPQNFMSCMPSNNLTQFSRAHELRPKDFVKLSDLSLVSQPRPRDSMYRMPNNNPTEPSLVYHPWQANSMYCLNPTSVSTLPLPNQGMSVSSKILSSSIQLFCLSLTANFSNGSNISSYGLGTLYQPMDFQATLDSSTMNHSTSATLRASHE